MKHVVEKLYPPYLGPSYTNIAAAELLLALGEDADAEVLSGSLYDYYSERIEFYDPSIEVAKKIADALEVSLDYLVGEGVNSKFDKSTLKRIEEIQQIEEDKKKTLFDVIDTFIRESKGRKAFAS